MVKNELSKRYYNYYLGIINTPEDQPQTSAKPAQEAEAAPAEAEASGEGEPATRQALLQEDDNGQPKEYLFEVEDFASLAEVAPIKLSSPAVPEPASGMAAQSSDKTAKKKWCFIATAAYGSPLAQEVVLLQRFRDEYLAHHELGEKFIHTYYRHSPSLAKVISDHQLLRHFTRSLLAPLIFIIRKGFNRGGSSRR